MENMEKKIERFIVQEILFGRMEHIAPDESLINSGILDSVTLLQLISFIEEQFDITVEDEEVTADNFETIQIMREFIVKKQEG